MRKQGTRAMGAHGDLWIANPKDEHVKLSPLPEYAKPERVNH